MKNRRIIIYIYEVKELAASNWISTTCRDIQTAIIKTCAYNNRFALKCAFGESYNELYPGTIYSPPSYDVTDTRIENFHDEDRGISITGFFKYGNQYKELHEDTVISFPFYEITFDILL